MNRLHVSPIERRALLLLCTLAPLRSTEVARALGITPTHGCTTVQALYQRGLLARLEMWRGHQRYVYWPTTLGRMVAGYGLASPVARGAGHLAAVSALVDEVLREPVLRRANDGRRARVWAGRAA